ncbi:TIGR04076 family protein [Intestinimonas timonensis]|uniref:TIGR04076 family protein n=1 Tax=Intestinimonas timonensis TaxID=1689270 RepID=UPI0010319C1A|nr:TIGR04076 family protein [Intestinimonas timonensis]
MKKVKITVLKTEFYPELADRYLTEGREAGPCPFQNVGDVFYYEGGAEKPEGLCPWAWIDLYRGISTLANGPLVNDWYSHEDRRILCCTDGVRPVIYELAVLDEDAQNN